MTPRVNLSEQNESTVRDESAILTILTANLVRLENHLCLKNSKNGYTCKLIFERFNMFNNNNN